MVGLGCGARSYTARLHYSFEWAVGARGVREILDAYVKRDDEAFARVDYGFELDEDERCRRHAILSLLSDEGLDTTALRMRFGVSADVLLRNIEEMVRREFARGDGSSVRLTDAGLERSDAIGPWLFSSRVRARMEGFTLR
jgi:oxygen-independent coproporphyrinogen-3 oxidase